MTLPPINWPEDGLVPVVIQDDQTNAVLMMAFMNQQALEATLSTGEVHFWSRSRGELWHKGASSGHVQHVRSISINCDQNSLLIHVNQIGAVCHEGYETCYFRDVVEDGSLAINQDRIFDPRDVYGDGFGLEALTRLWWGAFEYLRDEPLEEHSGTSRLLKRSDESVIHRIQDELSELAGVLDGSHIHTNQEDDLILEASQCCYWIAVEAIRRGISWEDARPGRALDVQEASADSATASAVLRAEALVLNAFSAGTANHLLHLIAEAARTIGIDPRAIIEHDLADLREKPYLAAFFAR